MNKTDYYSNTQHIIAFEAYSMNTDGTYEAAKERPIGIRQKMY